MTLAVETSPSSSSSSLRRNNGNTIKEGYRGLRRAYAAHKPKWQRYQVATTTSSVAATPASSSGGGFGGFGKQTNRRGGGPAKNTDAAKKEVTHVYQRQYAHVYHQRLSVLGPRCWETYDRSVSNDKGKATASVIGGRTNNNVEQRVDRVLDLRENVLSVVVGTLVKESGDDDGSGNDNDAFPLDKGVETKCRAGDKLYLEDGSGRVQLHMGDGDGKNESRRHHHHLLQHSYSTGVVLAVKGTVSSRDAVMYVDALYHPTLPVPSSSSSAAATSSEEASKSPRYLMLLSGLNCGGVAHSASSLQRDMLVSYMQGRFGADAANQASGVCRVVVAGGLVGGTSGDEQERQQQQSSWSSDKKKGPANANAPAASFMTMSGSTSSSLLDLDGFFVHLTSSGVPVDVLPGERDPTTANWPQRPLHKCLLKHSDDGGRNRVRLLYRTPNPYACQLDDKVVLGTDGRNVRDLQSRTLDMTKASNANGEDTNEDDNVVVISDMTARGIGKSEKKGDDKSKTEENDDAMDLDDKKETGEAETSSQLQVPSELDALEKTLRWNHVCPTGPDTVPTVPHNQTDPMIITETVVPHVYFTGNATKFDTKLVRVRVSGGDDDDPDRKQPAAAGATNNDNGNDGKHRHGCRLICVPEFSETGEAVLVNLDTLDVELLRFQAGTEEQ